MKAKIMWRLRRNFTDKNRISYALLAPGALNSSCKVSSGKHRIFNIKLLNYQKTIDLHSTVK